MYGNGRSGYYETTRTGGIVVGVRHPLPAVAPLLLAVCAGGDEGGLWRRCVHRLYRNGGIALSGAARREGAGEEG